MLTPSGELNLREEASTSARVLRTIPRLAEVTLYAWGNTWSHVAYQGVSGYVQSTYLTLTNPGTGPAATATPTAQQVRKAWVLTAEGGLNLRDTPSGDAKCCP